MKITASPATFCEGVIAAANIRPDKIAMTVIEPGGQDTITFGSMLAQIRSIAYRPGGSRYANGPRGDHSSTRGFS